LKLPALRGGSLRTSALLFHLDTTNHYAQASLETKRKALEQVDSTPRPTKPPHWKRDTDLLAWLDSL
jgi:hypothetical protein